MKERIEENRGYSDSAIDRAIAYLRKKGYGTEANSINLMRDEREVLLGMLDEGVSGIDDSLQILSTSATRQRILGELNGKLTTVRKAIEERIQ